MGDCGPVTQSHWHLTHYNTLHPFGEREDANASAVAVVVFVVYLYSLNFKHTLYRISLNGLHERNNSVNQLGLKVIDSLFFIVKSNKSFLVKHDLSLENAFFFFK